ncbi:hypothetical protein GJ744_005033 [Endocarpon pusillum]|uniref:Clr5 domain-containing protein n=1 Tax=Endocarpon pusillum TaxID=364733 RepID=A0A8H7E1A5_9EURO|nr:hypothetical protein GJ744_005033 [Endocarpon pusillum]
MEDRKTNEDGDGSIRKPTEEEWEANKGNISLFYSYQNLPFTEVLKVMEKLGFVATERMYKDKLNKWKMGKNASRQDWLAFARLYQCRTAGTSETSIQIYNKIRRIQDLKKYLKSHDEQEDAFFAEAIAS